MNLDEHMTAIEMIQLDDLILTEQNPRTVSKHEMDRLCKSMREDPEFIKCRPVLVNAVGPLNRQLNVYAGNQRVRAAKILGWTQIPCVIENQLSENVIKERTLKDNMHAGDWDFDMLANNFDVDMLIDVGFDAKQLELDLPEMVESSEPKQNKEKNCPHCGLKI